MTRRIGNRNTMSFKIGLATASGGIDADAANYFARITANGGTISDNSKTYINTFVTELKAANLWSKFYEIGTLTGDQLAAAQVKLKYDVTNGQPGTATNVNFIASDYVETGVNGGLSAPGVSKYFSVGFNCTTAGVGQNNWAFGFYGKEIAYPTNRGPSPIGDSTVGLNIIATNYNNADSLVANNETNLNSNFTPTGAQTGMFTSTRTASTGFVIYKNASILRTVTQASTGVANSDFKVGSDRFLSEGGTLIKAWFFAVGLTGAEISSFYTIMNTLQTSLNRNV